MENSFEDILPISQGKKEVLSYHSPVGWIEIEGVVYGEEEDKSNAKEFITAINFVEVEPVVSDTASLTIQKALNEITQYFEHKLTSFSFPYYQEGTHFQQAVWKELEKIPFGKTTTYQQLAKNMGDVKKIRAVGKANGKNRLAIVVPCHRVIGTNNDLIGYAGGLWRKEWLLEHEGVLPPRLF